ncbi:MAG: FHA domain-containing protein [Gammaproteobacteria bacterium]|nr:FHA domain-containing protein [Gammaproteobacteria bacterium]
MAMIIQTVDGVVSNRFDINESGLGFGRTPDNQVQIDDLAVSSQHARIYSEQDDTAKAIFMIEDLDSTNGTFVNENKITKQQLRHNDSIRVGWNVFIFIDENDQQLEQTSKIKKSWIPGVYYTKDK